MTAVVRISAPLSFAFAASAVGIVWASVRGLEYINRANTLWTLMSLMELVTMLTAYVLVKSGGLRQNERDNMKGLLVFALAYLGCIVVIFLNGYHLPGFALCGGINIAVTLIMMCVSIWAIKQ